MPFAEVAESVAEGASRVIKTWTGIAWSLLMVSIANGDRDS